ncbi:MAG: glycosyltransferase [Planctomycetota bacterium]|nr:glycosyltransferase [Planctomycetota bacterium]
MDVLFISYSRPQYTAMSLPSLLESAVGHARVWIWHNGDDPATLEVVRGFKDHPAVFQYRESPENVGLYPPIAWVMEEGKGAFVSKVDDDCVLPRDWISTLLADMHRVPRLGVVGCWRFQEEDIVPRLIAKKLVEFEGVQVLRNLWVEGSGFVLRRSALESVGGLRVQEKLPSLFRRVGCAGFVNGWRFPFIRQDHMDDPRSPNTALRTDGDLTNNLPLSAFRTGVRSVDAWTEQLRHSAWTVQVAPLNCLWYGGVMGRFRRLIIWAARPLSAKNERDGARASIGQRVAEHLFLGRGTSSSH